MLFVVVKQVTTIKLNPTFDPIRFDRLFSIGRFGSRG
jgi:hypothetical protein